MSNEKQTNIVPEVCVEMPESEQCCCCLSIRRGLLVWMYLKPVLGLLIIPYFYGYTEFIFFIPRSFEMTVLLLLFVIDVAFSILFVISARRENHKLMRIYYRYAVTVLILGLLALIGLIATEMCFYFEIAITPDIGFVLPILLLHTSVLFVVMDSGTLKFLATVFILLPSRMASKAALDFWIPLLHAWLVTLVRSEVLKLERVTQTDIPNHTSETE